MKADAEGIVAYASRSLCEVAGAPQREILGNDWRKLVHRDTPSAVLADVQIAMDRGEPFSGFLMLRRQDGDAVVYGVDVLPDVEPETEEVSGFHFAWRLAAPRPASAIDALFRDVREVEAAEQSPRRAERAGRRRLLRALGQERSGFEAWCARLDRGEPAPSASDAADRLTRCLQDAARGVWSTRTGDVDESDPLYPACAAADGLLDVLEATQREVCHQLLAAMGGERVQRVSPPTARGALGALSEAAKRAADALCARAGDGAPAPEVGEAREAVLCAEAALASCREAVGELADVRASSRLVALNGVITAGRLRSDAVTAVAEAQGALADRLDTVAARVAERVDGLTVRVRDVRQAVVRLARAPEEAR